jgi:hypothetical protein
MSHARFLLLPALAILVACDPTTTTVTEPTRAAARPGSPSDPTATWKIPLADAGLGFASDGLYGDGTHSVYANGVCGVSARIYATPAGSNTGDATIQTSKSKNCQRRFTLRFPDAYTELVPSFNNLLQLQNTSVTIPIGASESRRLIVNPGALANNPSRCGRLIFGANGVVGASSDSVLVTRVDAQTWQVASQGSQLAWCEADGNLYAMPVSFVVVASTALP